MLANHEGGRPVAVERKFTASRHCVENALGVLGQVCLPDPRFAEGVVHSLYWDTCRLVSYHEKLNGDFLKKKVRLRWYNRAEGPMRDAFLEIKHRIGGGRRKFRAHMELPASWLDGVSLADPVLRAETLARGGELAAEVPADFVPMLGMRYERRRFVCPFTGARMCLDSSIAVTRVNAERLPAGALPELPEIVFEFKDVGQMEIPWLGELAHVGFMSRSFSKYGEGIRRLLDGGAPA